ncbi:uncharacterized protein ARMOST_16204 [Armillaria ostoyae]|uniref:CCHC-type domain-containing protein n=1 Tax=Armillaria ostoyae TaxID=47428 RepID=A0A284RVI3_ARMOS|nr:uncharacterized protein ARMOST_16204 [Armillaria ostoyae]
MDISHARPPFMPPTPNQWVVSPPTVRTATLIPQTPSPKSEGTTTTTLPSHKKTMTSSIPTDQTSNGPCPLLGDQKPVLLQTPKPFKGDHDDIEHFLGNCITYFEAFSSYFQLCLQTVLFATFYFEGAAKDWWKKWVFNQITGTPRDSQTSPQKNANHTPTSTSQKAGGATSSLSDKPTSIGCDARTGRWTTYGGQRQPMDIGKLRAEGRCFRCHEKGHLGKDCPKKKEHKDIHLIIQVTTEQDTGSKVEEGNNNNNNNEEMTFDLCLQDDRCDTGDAAATTGRLSRWDTSGPLKSKQPSPLLLGPVWETLKGPSQSPARAQAKAAEPAGHGAESPIDMNHDEAIRAAPS